MNIKNSIIFLYQLILFFLFNLVLFYGIDFLLSKVPFLYKSDNSLVSIFVIVLFWLGLVFLDVKLIIPFLKKRGKKIIARLFFRTKKRKKRNKYIIVLLICVCVFLFEFWSIDFLFQKYTSSFVSFINLKSKNVTKIVNRIDYSGLKSVNVSSDKIENTSAYSDYGRFLRTYRWSPFIEKAEKVYGIEKGLLAGLIMQESFGNPLELNSSNDGGAGLMMFQPGTGKAYGLKTFGSSTETGRDKAHGLALKSLLVMKQYNYESLSTIDERFHVAKSIDAGARFLSELYGKHHSWDKAVSAYNRGKPALVPQSTKHVRMVRHFQKQYLIYLKGIKK